jgi:hypothetical protein
MGTNPRDPVVLIRSNPLERVDREVGLRVRERIKRIRTGPQPAAQSPKAHTSDVPTPPEEGHSDSHPPA